MFSKIILRESQRFPDVHVLFDRYDELSINSSFTWGSDTLIVLHSTDVAKRNLFCQLYVACSDTDVLLLLLHFYLQIYNNTVFHAITREIDVGHAYNALGNKTSMALLGFHAFTGCDLTERFSGFSKTTCFGAFLKSDPFVYKAFASLENNDDGLKKEIIDGLTKFILDLYQPKRPSNINTLRQLR